jgi:hypothetical protein
MSMRNRVVSFAAVALLIGGCDVDGVATRADGAPPSTSAAKRTSTTTTTTTIATPTTVPGKCGGYIDADTGQYSLGGDRSQFSSSDAGFFVSCAGGSMVRLGISGQSLVVAAQGTPVQIAPGESKIVGPYQVTALAPTGSGQRVDFEIVLPGA